MDLIYTPKTFKYDHVIRDEKGKPVGRVVMRDDDAYEPGKDIQVAILKIPIEFRESILGSLVFVDEYCYKLPDKLPNFRLNKRNKDWVASSFILCRDSN